jgi:hypothetical protein
MIRDFGDYLCSLLDANPERPFDDVADFARATWPPRFNGRVPAQFDEPMLPDDTRATAA